MFGALKRIFSKKPEPTPPPPPPERPASPPPPEPAAARGAAPRATPAPSGGRSNVPDETISIPLSPIVTNFPSNLTPFVIAHRGAAFSLSLRTALAQLPSGAVRVSYGELRKGSPAGAFSENSSQDASLVDLPLSLVLSKINPAYLSLKAEQKKIVIPDHVTAIFGPKDRQTVSPINANAKKGAPAVAPPPPPPEPEVEEPIAVEEPPAPIAVQPIAPPPPPPPPAAPVPRPAPAPAPIPIKPAQAPLPGPKPLSPLPSAVPKPPGLPKPPGAPLPSPLPRPPGSAPGVRPGGPPPVRPTSPLPFTARPAAPAPQSPLPSAAAQRPMPQPAAPAPAPVAAAPAPAPVEAGGDSITLALSAISEKWPQAVRDEIASLKNASVSLPVNKMEAGMKAGKLAFPWGDLSQWISPSPTVGAQNRQTMVEVPLSAAAPAFMAHRRPAAAQRKVEIPESIPGVFTGAQTPEAPVAAPAPAPEPAVPAEPERQTLGQLLGQPDRTDWSPQLITQHVCMGEGIAGCLLTASDGLLVSAQMPHHINCEILSAFVPQMFSRMSQSADEMRLGGVTGIVITAGSAPYGIYRAGSLYLVVLGEAGRGLPDTKLHQIAAEIAGINP